MEKESKFDPSLFRGRSLVTVKTGHTGIRRLYQWDNGRQKYIPRKDGKKYVATIKFYGTQKEKHFETPEEAKRWRLSGDGLREEALRMPFAEVMEKFFVHIQSRVNPSTWKTYKNSSQHLGFFTGMPMSAINSYIIDQWLLRIKQPMYLSDQHKTRFTYEKELKVLKQILKYYIEYLDETFTMPIKARHKKDAVIDIHRLKESKNRNQERYLSSDQQVAFLESLNESCGDKVYYYLAIFQLLTGTRIGEACAINWVDVDFDEDALRISKTVHWGRGRNAETYIQPFTKTCQSRLVPIMPSLKSLLLHMSQTKGKGLIFSDADNLPLKYRSIQYHFNRGFQAAGIKHSSTHILRHTYSTSFLTATKDHVSLSKLLGHQSTRQTEHYAKITSALTNQSFKEFSRDSEERLGKVLNFGHAAG